MGLLSNFKDLSAILMQELFENDLFNIDYIANKYNMNEQLKALLTNLYEEYFN